MQLGSIGNKSSIYQTQLVPSQGEAVQGSPNKKITTKSPLKKTIQSKPYSPLFVNLFLKSKNSLMNLIGFKLLTGDKKFNQAFNQKKILTPDSERPSPNKMGLEIECLMGNREGLGIEASHLILSENAHLGFTPEGDGRKIEHVTAPSNSYREVLLDALKGRLALRQILGRLNEDWTIIPGSTLPVEQEAVIPSKLVKPGTEKMKKLVENLYASGYKPGYSTTGSIHFNIGVDVENPDEIIRINNLMRAESPLILALSASSPFRLGEVTGNHSDRWMQFPQVPHEIPLFNSHREFIDWTLAMIDTNQMASQRTLWVSARPHGNNRPYDLNRVEVRISDLIMDWKRLSAILAWNNLAVEHFKRAGDQKISLKPLEGQQEMMAQLRTNELNAAEKGLQEGNLFYDFSLNSRETTVKDAINRRLQERAKLAEELGITEQMDTIKEILDTGNEASQKLDQIKAGASIPEVIQDWSKESQINDEKAYQELLS